MGRIIMDAGVLLGWTIIFAAVTGSLASFADEYTTQPITIKQASLLCPKFPKFPVVETTIDIVHAAFKSGNLTCTELVNIYKDRIQSYDKVTGLNAIQRFNPNLKENAAHYDKMLPDIISGKKAMPPLFCVPLLVKDNYDAKGMPTTNGAVALKDAFPYQDATMVAQLKKAGAIVLAKTNLAEWAFTAVKSVGSAFGVVRNPYDLNRVPAGSSGGTGAGVAANLGLIGLGTDTGNSIRGPSGHNSLVGIRPTIGLTSRAGIAPLRLNRDMGGPIGRTVRDVAKLLSVMAGVQDPRDPTTYYSANVTIPKNYEDFLVPNGLAGMTFGIMLDLVERPDGDPKFKALFYQVVANMTAAGAKVVNFTIPGWKAIFDGTEKIRNFPTVNGNYTVINATAGSSGAGFFLINGLYESISLCNPFKFDLDVYLQGTSARLNSTLAILNSGLIHPQSNSSFFGGATVTYTKESFASDPRWAGATCGGCTDLYNDPCRMALRKAMLDQMAAQGIDALIYLTWSNPARLIGDETTPDGNNSGALAPPTGTPSIVVPVGFVTYPAQGGSIVNASLPVSLQFLGKPFDEGTLFKAAYGVETLLKARRPPRGFGECGLINLV